MPLYHASEGGNIDGGKDMRPTCALEMPKDFTVASAFETHSRVQNRL